jgi:hypothetical protein
MAQLFAEAGRYGLAIPAAEFRARVGGEAPLRKLLAALTVTEKPSHGRPKHMAREVRRAYLIRRATADAPEVIYVPRIKGLPLTRARTAGGRPLLDGIRPAADALPAPRALDPARCAPDAPLYPYQEAAVEHLCAGPLAAGGCAGGVAYLQMDTGLGKTRVGAAVVARLGAPALVVVPTESIAAQWLEEFAEIYPDMVAAVYRNTPARKRDPPVGPATHDVVVVIVNTFRDKEPAFLEGFGTVLLDEAHELCSPRNLQALWLSQTRAVLGLSATPDEGTNGLDRYVMLHLGPPIYAAKIPGFDVGSVRFRGEVKIVEYAGAPEYCAPELTAAGTMSAIKTIVRVCADPHRARLVAAEILALARAHEAPGAAAAGLGPRPAADATPTHPAGEVRRHGVFCFAELRETLVEVRGALFTAFTTLAAAEIEVIAPELDNDAPAAPVQAEPDRVSILRGGVAAGEVASVRRARAHVVLTTYGFSRRGVSLPDMTAIVAITPRRNGTRQLLGRFLRRGSDESIVRQMVDIVDVRTGLKSQVNDRIKIYKEKKYPIRRVKADWSDYVDAAPAAPAEAPAAEDEDALAFADLTLDDLLATALGE